MTIDPKLQPPEATSADAVHTFSRAVLSCAPVVGGPIVELFNTVFSPSLEKRRAEWMQGVAQAITDLQNKKGISIEDLKSNQAFFDTVFEASQIYVKTSQEEKKAALKNAVFNSPLPDSPALATQQIFLSIIDSFSEWHIRFLFLFDDPPTWAMKRNHRFPELSMGGIVHIIQSAFPEMNNKEELTRKVWKDLYNEGLVNTENLGVTMSAQGLMARRTSDFGREFLKFISQ